MPLSTVTLAFGVLSIPLAFMRQLCVPALIMGVLALLFHVLGRAWARHGNYFPASIRRSLIGARLALAGSIGALVMWVLWASSTLFR